MKLIEATYEQLHELMELIINEKIKGTFEQNWVSKEHCIADIHFEVGLKGYDGDIDNYDAIYWYFTGKARASDAVEGKNNKEEHKEEPKNEKKDVKT